MKTTVAADTLASRFLEEKKLSTFINILFEKVSFLSERKHISDKYTLQLVLEFFPVGGKEKGKAFVSPEEKSLKAAISKATSASKSLRSVNVTDVDSLKKNLGDFVNSLIDVSEKTHDLDPEEIDPSTRNAMEVLYGMAAYTLSQAKATIDFHAAELKKSIPSFVLRNAVKKYLDQKDHNDMASMVKSINVPLWKRLGSLATGSGLGGGMPSAGERGIHVR